MPLPLAGIRVLDITIPWAGAYAAGVLACLGAEVIMIESPFKKAERFGGGVGGGVTKAGLRDLEMYSLYCDLNKKSIMVNLKDPRGAELVRELVGVSDVLLENFGGPAVTEGYGLGHESLMRLNPRLIYCGMPGMGMTGPERDHLSFGVGVEQLAGLVALQGYEDSDSPHKSGINYGDPIAGMLAAGAIITALYRRRRTGRGGLVDLAQRDAMTMLIADEFMEYAMNRRQPPRLGNHHRWMVPHNVYPASGEDAWVFIACRDDVDWWRLCEAIGRSGLAREPRFATMLDRKRNEAELDRLIGEWTAPRKPPDVQELLQRAGVPAGRVAHVEEIPEDPHVRARTMWRSLAYPHNGMTYPLPMLPWRSERVGDVELRPAPFKGADTEYALGLVGRAGEMEQLIEEGVVGRPLGAAS